MKLLTVIVLFAGTLGLAHADGAGSATTGSAEPRKIPEEQPVPLTPLIIAGVALAAFAVVYLVGRRKRSAASAEPVNTLAEVRLVIETDERATVWTLPSHKLQTDRLGEVVLHLEVGSHVVHIQIGEEQFTRQIHVPAPRKMRVPMNFAKERISRGVSGQMPAVAIAPQPARTPSSAKPPTSMARAYPDSTTQGQLGAQLAGLIDVELEPGAVELSPQREAPRPAPTRPPPLQIDVSTPALDLDPGLVMPDRAKPITSPPLDVVAPPPPRAKPPSVAPRPANLDISLDDIAPVKVGVPAPSAALSAADLVPHTPSRPHRRERERAANAVADFEVTELGPVPQPAELSIAAPDLDLAPPQASAREASVPSIDIGELGGYSPAPVTEAMPQVSAGSVGDLQLDELPLRPQPKRSPKPTPDIDQFRIDEPGPAVVIGHRYRKATGAGAGPLGALYRGRDENAGRDVWIEELPRSLVLGVPAATLAKLDHANILRFADHVVEPTKCYVVSELVEGKSLDQVLAERRGPMAALEAITLIDQICAALAYAHERGVIHGNVRPACVWASGRTIRLTGFGMSLAGQPHSPYQAPELAVGAHPDVRSDLYSIGVLFAQLVTGRVPPPGAPDLPTDVPRSLAGLIRKLVSREPMIRPSSVKQVRDAFASVF